MFKEVDNKELIDISGGNIFYDIGHLLGQTNAFLQDAGLNMIEIQVKMVAPVIKNNIESIVKRPIFL